MATKGSQHDQHLFHKLVSSIAPEPVTCSDVGLKEQFLIAYQNLATSETFLSIIDIMACFHQHTASVILATPKSNPQLLSARQLLHLGGSNTEVVSKISLVFDP